MIHSPASENILSELDNPNLLSEEREALQILAALLAEQWRKETQEESKAQAA